MTDSIQRQQFALQLSYLRQLLEQHLINDELYQRMVNRLKQKYHIQTVYPLAQT